MNTNRLRVFLFDRIFLLFFWKFGPKGWLLDRVCLLFFWKFAQWGRLLDQVCLLIFEKSDHGDFYFIGSCIR